MKMVDYDDMSDEGIVDSSVPLLGGDAAENSVQSKTSVKPAVSYML